MSATVGGLTAMRGVSAARVVSSIMPPFAAILIKSASCCFSTGVNASPLATSSLIALLLAVLTSGVGGFEP